MAMIGVVTIAHGSHDHLRRQQESLRRGSLRPELHVVVAMDDPALCDALAADTDDGLVVVPVDREPRGLPLAAARNRGMSRAIEAGCDVLIGLEADCIAGPELVHGYVAAVRCDPATVWSGPVTRLEPPPDYGYDVARISDFDAPHPARPAPRPGERLPDADPDHFWSLSFALSRAAWVASGGFDEAYVGHGGEDTDFGHRCAANGLGLGWDGTARAYQQHHPVQQLPVNHVDDILRNGRIFRDRWGRWPMQSWLVELERRGLVRRTHSGWIAARTDEPTPSG